MKKKIQIISLITSCLLVVITTTAVFLPSLARKGLIGIYQPIEDDGNALYSSFQLKANNKAIVNFNSTGENQVISWYAKCDGERTSIYLHFSEEISRQFNLTDSKELKDINHGDVYKKV